MKKFLLATLATAIVATPLAAAPASAQSYRQTERTVIRQGPHRTVVVQQNRGGPRFRNDWRRGQRFDYRQARDYRVINDYRRYNLRTPPRGYHYVQSGNDAVLVALTSGIIGAVLGNVIR